MAGVASLRQGSVADAVDGVVPAHAVEPRSGEELAGLLSWASGERLSTVLRGGGTKIGWGRPPASVDLVVHTGALKRLVAHRHGDLTVTVQAGARLHDVNRELARLGQWLPLDTAFDAATIGGILATNDSGPQRHRNGTPRDLLIGITLALTDGRLVKAGGTVVKNVAGYDLGKLVTGSYGSYAAIVDATFRLLPRPQASGTLVATYADAAALARDAAALSASQLEPALFDVRAEVGTSAAAAGPASQLLVRFASSPAATNAQLDAARALLTGGIEEVTGAQENLLWDEQVRAPWTGEGAVLRLGWLPANLKEALTLVQDLHRVVARGVSFAGRAGVGAGLVRLNGDLPGLAAAVTRLRGSGDVGNVVLLRGSRELKRQIDTWGPAADAVGVSRALKHMFDPAGILNAGRGPV